jgi:hypothetical protein
MINELYINRFTLFHKVGIKFFYKVVNIIQEHTDYKHMSSTAFSSTTTMLSQHINLRCFKDTQKQLLLTSHALTRLNKTLIAIRFEQQHLFW